MLSRICRILETRSEAKRGANSEKKKGSSFSPSDGCIDRGGASFSSSFAAATEATLQLSGAAGSLAARRRRSCFHGGAGAGASRAHSIE